MRKLLTLVTTPPQNRVATIVVLAIHPDDVQHMARSVQSVAK